MKQAALGLNLSRKRTRKREFLEEMQRVVPWSDLIALIEPHYPKARTGRPPMGIDVMLSQRPSRRKISGESRHRQRVHRGFIGIAVPDALIRRSLVHARMCIPYRAHSTTPRSGELSSSNRSREQRRLACRSKRLSHFAVRTPGCRMSQQRIGVARFISPMRARAVPTYSSYRHGTGSSWTKCALGESFTGQSSSLAITSCCTETTGSWLAPLVESLTTGRSEERRVGEEGR